MMLNSGIEQAVQGTPDGAVPNCRPEMVALKVPPLATNLTLLILGGAVATEPWDHSKKGRNAAARRPIPFRVM